jgi:hypothetical protein
MPWVLAQDRTNIALALSRYRMTLEDYDRILEDAFSFLISEFSYSSQPAQSGGGRFGSGLTKTFTRGRQTITLLIGDADSQVFCDVFFSDGQDAQVKPARSHFRHRSLYFLLKRKCVDLDLPDKGSLDSDAAKRDALVACGNLVKEHALDVVNGDFSAFPELVYVVQHVDRQYPTGEVRRLIGVYSSFNEATKAISERLIKPGFVVRQDGFEIDCLELNRGNWAAGIEISPSEQATELFMRVLKGTNLAEFNPDERRQIEAQWLANFSAFQDQFEVSRAKTYPKDHPQRAAVLARYPRDHIAWSVVLDQAELHRRRIVFVEDLRNRPIALECWRKLRQAGSLSSRFVAFIDEELRDLK